jgi:UDP-3-O-[3-hydroxymyristoyl] N-acetylglucosamine deacetylase
MIKQKTVANKVYCKGVGLHSGLDITLTLAPAPEDAGIVFKRTDNGLDAIVPASYKNVADTRLCTCLSDDKGNLVSTTEHLMAAFHAFGITNVIAEVSGPELPLMDGSAADFVFLLREAGVKEQSKPAKFLQIKKTIRAEEDGAYLEVSAADKGLTVDFDVEYPCKFIGRQRYVFSLSEDAFADEIAPARTFGLEKEVEMIRAAGLAKGGSLDNVLIANDDGVLNPGGVRFPDEFVRHKILDLIGDMYTSGYSLIGKLTANKSGHKINNMLLKTLFADKDAWEIVELPE